MAAQSDPKPVLWQIEISHYSEKVRWALDCKRIPHVRRTPLPGTHIPIALFLTRRAQPTFPVLQMDGRTIGDSTAIIAALEAKHLDGLSTPRSRKSACGHWSWRTGSTRTSGPTRASSPSTS